MNYNVESFLHGQSCLNLWLLYMVWYVKYKSCFMFTYIVYHLLLCLVKKDIVKKFYEY